MLLIMCHAGANRYAIDSRHVNEVLPRANLSRLSGSPAWLAGMLLRRGSATPVVDLSQLTEGRPCPGRLSSRIVILQMELGGRYRQFGVLVERVGLREIQEGPRGSGREVDAPAALGTLHLDEQGLFQLIDIPRLVSGDRQAILFSTAEKGR